MRAFGVPLNDSDTRRLEAAHHSLQAAHKGMLEVMSIMQNGMQHISEKLAEERKLAVQYLPDEILMHIFECVFDDDDRVIAIEMQELFPLVCKRWRTILYAIPRFWNKVQSFRPPKVIDACLERSKGAGLEIHFGITKQDIKGGKDMPAEIARFCAQVLPHSQRWESFSVVTLNVPLSSTSLIFKSIREQCGSLELPNLRSMQIKWTNEDGSSDEEQLNNDDLHFYSSWSMPQLSKLEVDNFIPRSCVGNTLASCDLSFGALRWTDMEFLSEFLQSMKRVQELKLSFQHIDADTWPDERTSLPNLQKLSLVFNEETHESAPGLVQMLDVPNVADINLTATLDEWTELRDLVSCFDQEDAFESVEKLSIHVDRSSTAFDQLNKMVFDTFPNLEYLKIRAQNAITDVHTSSNDPNLTTFICSQCDVFDGNVAKDIIDQMERDGLLDEFKNLAVVDMPMFSPQRYVILRKLSKKKVNWE